MFDMLFKLDEKGKVIPIEGKTLRLMPDGIPMIMNESTSNLLGGNSNNDPFAPVRTNKTFREISNEIAMESPLGKKSAFYREEREIIKGEIPKL